MKKLLLILLLPFILFSKERIITLSPAVNEIIFALGMGDEIVANTDYALFPEASKKLPKVGGYFSPNIEKILFYNPSLVVMQDNNTALNKKLKRLNIKTKIIKIDKLNSIKKAILDLGKLLNRESRAKEIVKDINFSLQAIQNIVKNKKILIVFGRSNDLSRGVFVAGQNLYYDEIINESNNNNALQSTRKGQPILNMENIIASQPDIVLLLARHENSNLSDKALINAWKKLPIPASKENAIFINPYIYAGIPSDRLILFLKDFKKMLEDYKSIKFIKKINLN